MGFAKFSIISIFILSILGCGDQTTTMKAGGAPLLVTPTTISLKAGYSHSIQILDGIGPYSATATDGGAIAFEGNELRYHSKGIAGTSAQIQIQDSAGKIAEVAVSLEPEEDWSLRELVRPRNPSFPCGPGGVSECYELLVDCVGDYSNEMIPDRRVNVRYTAPTSSSEGIVFYTTGGRGQDVYGNAANGFAARTLGVLRADNLESAEISYPDGWPLGAEGSGIWGANCATAAVTRWILKNVAQNSDSVCMQGNSGGSQQIMIGMAKYGLSDVVDAVMPSAGPPVSDPLASCKFTPAQHPLGFPVISLGIGPGLIDETNGWLGNGDYCSTKNITPIVEDRLEKERFYHIDNRKYFYPNTTVRFLYSSNEPGRSPLHADLVHALVLEAGSVSSVVDVMNGFHEVQDTDEGSAEIIKAFHSAGDNLCRK